MLWQWLLHSSNGVNRIQSSELTMVLLYCFFLVPVFIGWLIIRRTNKRIDDEEEELRKRQAWARCSCGFEKMYDKRKLTLTECPDCGNPVGTPPI